MHWSDPVQVNISLALKVIIDLDDDKNVCTTNAWLTYQWVDNNLKWKKSGDYSDNQNTYRATIFDHANLVLRDLNRGFFSKPLL